MRSCFSATWSLFGVVIILICLRDCKWWGGGVGVVYSARVPLPLCAMSQPRRRKGENLFAKRDINLRAHHIAKQTGLRPDYQLTFFGSMLAGAVSRSVAQTAMHPANVIKTLLQMKGSFEAILPLTPHVLARGAGAQFLLSLPSGAIHFIVLERAKTALANFFPNQIAKASAAFDFISSSLATIVCSAVNTPQMVLTNRIMAGVYPNLVQIKDIHYHVLKRLPTPTEDFNLGCLAAALSVTVMIPMDSVKTRLVTQTASSAHQYRGILDCFSRMLREEGIGSFYNSLTPRLISVVPQVGIQYAAYEFIKRSLAEGAMSNKDIVIIEEQERIGEAGSA